MLEFGFAPHLPGVENSTPIDRAAFHGHREIVELLIEVDSHPPLEFKNAHGGTPLGACVFGSVHGWKQGTDYLGTAQALIDAGSEVNPDWLPCKNKLMDQLLRKHLSNR
jgi:ankyrin repeat protein